MSATTLNMPQPPYAAITELMDWATMETVHSRVPAKQLKALTRSVHAIVAPYRRALGPRSLNSALLLLIRALRNGPQSVTALLARAKRQGISEKTLRRAATNLGVRKYQHAANGAARWMWELEVR